MQTLSTELAKRLIEIMRVKKISSVELASRTSLSTKTIARLRQGELGSGESLIQIAIALDISLDWLCSGIGFVETPTQETTELLKEYHASSAKMRHAVLTVLKAGNHHD